METRNAYQLVVTISNEDLAVVVEDVLNDRFDNLQFKGVENGCGGYDIYVRKIHTLGQVKEKTIEKIQRLLPTIQYTFIRTDKVILMRSEH